MKARANARKKNDFFPIVVARSQRDRGNPAIGYMFGYKYETLLKLNNYLISGLPRFARNDDQEELALLFYNKYLVL